MSIRRQDYSILVEGQMDLVMMHQAGLSNSVASSGTALTETHLKRLSRLSNRVILAFDGDAAGLKAVFRAAEIGLSLGMEVKVAEMPEGSDPADLALEDKEKLVAVFRNSKHIISFALARVLAANPDKRVAARKIAAEVLPLVAKLPIASEQSHFVTEISAASGITEEALRQDMKRSRDTLAKKTETNLPSVPERFERIEMITRKLFGILLWKKSEELRMQMTDLLGNDTFVERMKQFEKNEAIVFETEAQYTDDNLLHADITELLDNLHEEILKKRFSETQRLLREAEMNNDTAETRRLLEILNTIWQKK